MSRINENAINLNDELSKVNLSLHEKSIEFWRVEQKCRLKLKSIDDIEKSTLQINLENYWLENQLQDKESRMEEIKEYIVSMDNIILSFYETLAHLEVGYNKKQFSINKSKNNQELQLFIRMELWQKEEERFNNIPEVKSLKIANTELNNTKLEYEKLLDCKKNLIEEIKKTEKQNNERLNDVVVEFVKVYVEMLTLNKREENCIHLLRKLKTEYNEKLNTKNELLEFSKKKVNKISFWTHNFCPFDSKMIDIKLDSLGQELKPQLKYSNSHHFSDVQQCNNKEAVLKCNNKPKKKVTFLLSSEDQISSKNNDILNEYEHKNTNLVKNKISNNDIDSNSSLTKDDTLVNMNAIQQYQKHFSITPSNINFNKNEKLTNEHDVNFQTKKLKITKANSDFEFIKPFNPVQQENHMNKNLIQKTVVQPNTTNNENIHNEKNVIEHQEKVRPLNLLSNNQKNKSNCLSNDIHLQGRSSLESVDQSNLKNFSNESNKIFELQSIETSSEPNSTFLGLFLNDYDELKSQDSSNSSFCGSDLSGLSGNLLDISQYQSNFTNSFNSNLRTTTESNLQELSMKNPQQSGLFLNDYVEQASLNSINSSFRGSDLSELFSNSFSTSQHPNMQLNFSNSFNTNSNAISESNLQELNVKNPQQPGL